MRFWGFCATIIPMQILVISDIHANLTALETVLEHAGDYETVWCLGDVVGYGPDPNECIDIIRDLPNLVCLLGNHDAAALNQLDLNTFNPEARLSVEWMQKQLTPESYAFLESRQLEVITEHVTLVHGSPREPVYEYLLDTQAATENFDFFSTKYCFVGHTHLPVIFSITDQQSMAKLAIPPANEVTELQPREIINPGSVGQPRDRDSRAAYAIYDTEKFTWDYRRIEYDINSVQARMTAVDLTERHVTRLQGGW